MVTKESDKTVNITTDKRNQVSEDKIYSHLLQIPDKKREEVRRKIFDLKQEVDIKFWEEPNCKVHWIPVDGGEIRVLHVKPKNPESKRPIVFVPGWQTMGHQFQDLISIIHNRVEFYFVESRESYTSKIRRRKADFSIAQKAKDTQRVIDYLKLRDQDFALFGSCWGASLTFQGLIDKTLTAPTIVTFSPMYRVPVGNLIKFLTKILPPFLFNIGLKILAKFYFKGENAETQKGRMLTSIKESVPWKWRRTILDNANMNLFGDLFSITEEVNVVGGTHDKIHDENTYPRFADETPNGHFYYYGIDQSERELTMGLILLEISKTTKELGLPKLFTDYEVKFD